MDDTLAGDEKPVLCYSFWLRGTGLKFPYLQGLIDRGANPNRVNSKGDSVITELK
jgi:hypothetical protein